MLPKNGEALANFRFKYGSFSEIAPEKFKFGIELQDDENFGILFFEKQKSYLQRNNFFSDKQKQFEPVFWRKTVQNIT